MKFSLSFEAISHEIFALSALMTVTGAEREALTRDHLPGLRRLVRNAFASVSLRLADLLSGTDMDAEDPQLTNPYQEEGTAEHPVMRLGLTFLREAPHPGSAIAVRRQLEHAVALQTLAEVYGPATSLGSSYFRRAADTLEQVRGALDLWPCAELPRIVACYY